MQQLTLRQRLLVASMLFGMFFGAGNLIFPASMGQLAGLLSSLLMAVIYLLVTVVGAQSRGQFAAAANGGEALARIAAWYFGGAGAVILAVTVTVACLKTAVGLITSCGETFVAIFPGGPSYRVWAAAFCVLSFLLANLGLDAILDYSLPVLMFLYPLAIVLILLTLGGGLFGNDRRILRWTIGCTAVAAAVRPGLRLGLPGAGRAGRRPGGAPPAPPQLKAGPRQRLAALPGAFACSLP